MVSARRWQREGPLHATLRNWMLRSAYALGADPERLVRRYAPNPPGGSEDEEAAP